MSVTYFLLFFLCIALHACSARHLSIQNHKKLEKKLHFPIKDDVKGLENFIPRDLQVMKDGNMMKASKGRKSANNKRMLKGMRKDSSKTSKSVDSVSWSVPHDKKPIEKDPGFNLDYSPPKTHPPSHN